MRKLEADVVVVGAGVAGLAAAGVLTRAGQTVITVEARDRIGGRVFSVIDTSLPHAIELGAEFIHGRPPSLLKLIRDAKLLLASPHQDSMSYEAADGKIVEADDDLDAFFEKLLSLNPGQHDESVTQYLDSSQLPDRTKSSIKAYVEGFNAADSNLISMQALAFQQRAEAKISGSDGSRLPTGYNKVPEAILANVAAPLHTLLLNTIADRLSWSSSRANLSVRSAEERFVIEAKRAIVTVPLPLVNASDGLIIDPVPQQLLDMKSAIAIGSVLRVSFRFRDQFWRERAPNLNFIFSDESNFPVWWALPDLPILTAWMAGPAANNLANRNKDRLIQSAVKTLATIFSMAERDIQQRVEASFFHDWQSDPYSRGAYSYVTVGRLQKARSLAEVAGNNVCFAGEACAVDGHWGTVHGAYDSGIRVAELILDSV